MSVVDYVQKILIIPFDSNYDSEALYKNFNIILNLQENRTYSLWVTTYDGSIPQRTEVIATVTDNTGQRPHIPHPPPFSVPNYPIPFNQKPLIPQLPYRPKFTTTTQPTTKAEAEDESTVPDTTSSTALPPKADKPHKKEANDNSEVKKNNTIESEPTNGTEMPFTVISLVAIGGLVVVVAAVIGFIWKRNNDKKTNSKKEDMVSKVFNNIIKKLQNLNTTFIIMIRISKNANGND